MEEISDEALWRRLLDGEQRAFGPIWDRHRDRVFRRLLGFGHTKTDAEDLSAVVFLELWRRRRAVRFVDESLLPWLLVTAQNVSRNAARSRRRYETALRTLPSPEPIADPADAVAARNSADALALRSALHAVDDRDRHLLVLTALEGFTVREAAAVLRLTESAAKMRLSRLRRRLSSSLRLPVTDPAAFEGGPS